jgi:hypothetical protein
MMGREFGDPANGEFVRAAGRPGGRAAGPRRRGDKESKKRIRVTPKPSRR